MKEVIAAIIIKEDLFLIAQRGKNEKLAGKWEFPGGKMEKGEMSLSRFYGHRFVSIS